MPRPRAGSPAVSAAGATVVSAVVSKRATSVARSALIKQAGQRGALPGQDYTFARSGAAPHQAEDQRDDEADEEHEEEDLRDAGRAGSDATEAEDGRDERDDEEHDGVMKHEDLLG